ncbi:MAG TPA: YHS domain-containing protein [Puia sp.]|nr:YHS domain-containing protein [Puia sp.]
MRKYMWAVALMLGILSCRDNKRAAVKNNAAGADSSSATSKARFKDLKFDNTKDLSCGMPLTAGVEDTVHYKGKLYGFCSKECKDAFLKDPASYLAKNK